MNCYECAKSNDTVPAVAREFRVGGTPYACAHEVPRVKPLRGAPAGIAAAARHQTASVS